MSLKTIFGAADDEPQPMLFAISDTTPAPRPRRVPPIRRPFAPGEVRWKDGTGRRVDCEAGYAAQKADIDAGHLPRYSRKPASVEKHTADGVAYLCYDHAHEQGYKGLGAK